MDNKKENKSMTIKEGWFCNYADFDCKEPYIIVVEEQSNNEEKILIPETLAYYLRTHFCGSMIMRTTMKENAIKNFQYKLKELLGINEK